MEALDYAGRMAFASIDELESALAEASYLTDRGLATALFLARHARQAAAARGRGGRRQDRGGEGDRRRAGRVADPAAVLRGSRRLERRLRVELRPPAAAHPRRAGGHRRRGRALRPRVPDPPAAARGDRVRGPGRAADRRGRPGRRGVRGVPARGALGLPGHDPRARHDRGQAPADRDPDLEPHPRAARRAQAPLPLPLDRAPVGRPRDRDRAAPRARRPRAARGARRRGSRRSSARSTCRSRRESPRRSTGCRR